jgi:hypothetical protein
MGKLNARFVSFYAVLPSLSSRCVNALRKNPFGVPRLDMLDANCLDPADPVVAPQLHSAFPLQGFDLGPEGGR